MKVLITGLATSGSWAIRGEQLGAAIGATVQPRAHSARGYDAVVIVKRLHDRSILRSARWHGVPIVWDVVDAWRQGKGRVWTPEKSMAWLRQSLRQIRPDAVIAPTRHMANDLAHALGKHVKVTTLAHHAWQGRPINPIRPEVRSIGYEGGEKHLGEWATVLADEATRRGWRFVINPPCLSEVDIAIAVRRDTGYAARAWKSNVKLANAQATGTPIILARESGYLETASGAEYWADTPSELQAGLDWFAAHDNRVDASQQMLGAEPKLADLAAAYRQWLQAVCHDSKTRNRRRPMLVRRLWAHAWDRVAAPFQR